MRCCNRLRNTDGVSAVEFGLVLPLLLVLVLGIIDYGYVFFVDLTLTNAAREGARVGVTRDGTVVSGQSNIVTAAETATQAYLDSAGISATIEVDPPTTGDPTDDDVKVTVTIEDFVPLVGFVPLPPSLSISSSMRWELAERLPGT